jgi:MFS family permease
MEARKSGDSEELRPALPVRLGIVSFLNDCSSEILTRSLPLFFTTGLGLSPLVVGVVEGVSDTVSILVNAWSGWLSDRMPSRKPLVVAGYSLSALGRTLMFFSSVAPVIAAARIFDRFGKGIRTAPRDALIADGSRSHNVGRAFGVARSLDTIGAVFGLSLAIYLGIGQTDMTISLFQKMLLMSVPFAWLASILAWIWIPRLQRHTRAKVLISWHIPREIRPLILAIAIFALGSSSDAFLVLRARELGFDFGQILALFIAFNILASVVGWLAGVWSDRFGRYRFLLVGWLVYALCYIAMGHATSMAEFAIGFAIYGAFYGLTDGIEKAFLADLLSPHKRGLGYGSLQTVMATVAIPANLMTGYIATEFGLPTALRVSAVISVLGVFVLMAVRTRLKLWVNPESSSAEA